MSCEDVEVYHLNLHNFEYPDNEDALTASHLLYDDDNPGLVRNEEVKHYTLPSQVLAKIVYHNLLSKSGEYSHTRGCSPLLIYCLLRGNKVNISKLIIDFLIFDHLLIPSRNLPYGMILTRLFKHFKINLSDERCWNLILMIHL